MMNLKDKLFEFEDVKYKSFFSKLTKTKYPLIGVRIPFLKKIAKELKGRDIDFLNSIYFEEVMIEGLMIGYLNDIDDVTSKLKKFVKKIDDWSICDSCCANLKITSKNKEKMWDFIVGFATSNKEFELRFMIVMMMDYYLDEKYISKIFGIIDNVKCNFYYTNMAISWLIATALVKKEKETLEYLKKCNLSNFVYNKAISKACESYRVSEDIKKLLKKMKR